MIAVHGATLPRSRGCHVLESVVLFWRMTAPAETREFCRGRPVVTLQPPSLGAGHRYSIGATPLSSTVG